jgi:hypothetical protein
MRAKKTRKCANQKSSKMSAKNNSFEK